MRTALTDDDSLNFRLASRAGPVGASKYVQFIAVTSLMFGDGIKIGFAGPQGGAEIFQASFQDPGNGQAQGFDFRFRQGGCQPQGVQPGFPERFIHVDIAESCDHGLVEQQGL